VAVSGRADLVPRPAARRAHPPEAGPHPSRLVDLRARPGPFTHQRGRAPPKPQPPRTRDLDVVLWRIAVPSPPVPCFAEALRRRPTPRQAAGHCEDISRAGRRPCAL